MNAKKLLIATVSGFVVMFILSWAGHTLVISEMFAASPMASIEREVPLIYGLASAYLTIALLMAYLYPKGVEGESVFGNGIRFGVLIGLLISLPISLILYSILTVPFGQVIVEAVWHMIEQGAGGVAIAYVYGLKATVPAAEPV